MTEIIKSPIEQPIEQKHSGKGVPSAILHHDSGLNSRQKELLNVLPDYDSMAIVPKNTANMNDLAALTAETGVEFAMFTKGQERLIIRGNESRVNVTADYARELSELGYRWSGHTHPGVGDIFLQASLGDVIILRQFGQEQSVIYNSSGSFKTFQKE